MFSHVFVGVTDFERAFGFDGALTACLGNDPRFCDRSRPSAGWQSTSGPRPLCLIGKPHDATPHAPGNGQMVAFLAESRLRVDRAYQVALAHGGSP